MRRNSRDSGREPPILLAKWYLFQGTAFLVLTLVTIIWRAAVDQHQTWLIWVSGIALGLGIILLFALFEKKRAEVLSVVESLKEWQG